MKTPDPPFGEPPERQQAPIEHQHASRHALKPRTPGRTSLPPSDAPNPGYPRSLMGEPDYGQHSALVMGEPDYGQHSALVMGPQANADGQRG